MQRNADGKVVVHLTTTKPVREPFLNFLVEVIWPSGRLLREYALLIDPPIYSEEPIAPVQQVQSSSVASKTPTAFEEEAQVAAQPVDVNASNAETSAVQSTTSDVSDGTYGPTSNSDTMWAIALKVRPNDTVTAQQTMLAIQDLNPDSFIQNNINTLKKGQILRLPTINQIRQRSKRDAVRDMIVQNRNFENKALSKNVVDATPDETMPVASQQVSGGDELKLVVASDAAGKSAAGFDPVGYHDAAHERLRFLPGRARRNPLAQHAVCVSDCEGRARRYYVRQGTRHRRLRGETI